MPLRGENVGTAYVRIIADGSGLGKSIRDSFKDDDTFGKVGKDKSQQFTDGFEEDMESAPTRDRLRKAISGPIARGKWLNDDFFKKNGPFDEFVTRLRTQYGEAGERAGEEMTRGLMSGRMDLRQLDKELDNILPRIVKHQEQIAKEAADAWDEDFNRNVARLHAEALAEQSDQDRDFEQEAARLHAEALHEQADRDRQFEENVTRLHEEAIKDRMDLDKRFEMNHEVLSRRAAKDAEWLATLERAHAMNRAHNAKAERDDITLTMRRYKDLTFQIDRMSKGQKIEGVGLFGGGDFRRQLSRELSNVSDEMARLGLVTKETHYDLRDHERTLHLMHPTLNKFDRAIDEGADSMAKAFGKGSRNDFLNFTGSMAGGIARLVKVLPNGIRLVSDFFGRAQLAGKRGGPISALGSMLGDLGKVAGSVGVGLVAAFGIVGPLLAILSQLAGVVVALASNLSFSLVGALGAAGGAVLPLIAGLAVAGFGFANLEGDAKKAAKGIVDEFKDLGSVAAEGLTFAGRTGDLLRFDTRPFETQMNIIRGMVQDLRPLTRAVGQSMGYAIDIFIDRINKANGPWEKFIDSMDGGQDKIGWLATNARIAGRVITEAFGGLLGLLRALAPSGHAFLDWLRGTLITFDDWINSAKGQNSVKDFMDDALASLKDFGDFLGSTWDLLRTFLSAGKDAGDSMFASMSDAIDGWVKTLQDNPEVLERWFDDAEHFGDVLGNLLTSLGELFSSLDNEFSRALSSGAIGLLADAIGLIADTLSGLADMFGISDKKMGSFAGQAAAAAIILPRMSGALTGLTSKLTGPGGFVSGIGTAGSRMTALKGAARGLAGPAGIGLLIHGATQSNKALGVLEQAAGGAAIGLSMGGPLGAIIGGFAGGLIGVASHASHAGRKTSDFGTILHDLNAPTDRAEEAMQGLKDTLDEVTGATTSATRAFVLQKLQEQGLISTGQKFGLTAREMIDAAMGQGDAMGKLGPIYKETRDRIDDIATAQGEALTMGNNDEFERLQKEKEALREKLVLLNRMPGTLREQGRAVRAAAAATADYSGMLHGIPPDVKTYINNVGMSASIRDWVKVGSKIDDIDRKQVKTLIEATGDTATKAKIDAVMRKINDLDRKRPKPSVEIDHSPFDRGIDGVNSALTNVGGRNVSPKITLTSNVDSIVGDVNYALDHIADEVVNVYTHNAGKKASGGLFNSQAFATIGEAGPEAVVPLNRPLGEVDPSVRWLSAIAQGRAVTSSSSKTIDVGGITVISNSEDPKAVAVQTLNQLVASTY